jgi:hypothetical protein
VIDMRDDAEISGQLDRHKALHYAGASSVGQSAPGAPGGANPKCQLPNSKEIPKVQNPETA